jgi:hypothetical protein
MRAGHALGPILIALTVLGCPAGDDAADSAVAAAPGGATACVTGGGIPTITSAGVGPLRVGERLSNVSSRCTVRDTTFSLGEGIQENGRVVDLGGSSAVLIVGQDTDPVIERIIVADSSIRTDAGIGVGKTVGALRAAYGRICAAMGEGEVVVAVPPLSGVSFGTSATASSIPARTKVESNPEAIPDNATIRSIWLHSGGSLCGGS